MLANLKRGACAFVILFAFTFIISAQTIENSSEIKTADTGLTNFKKNDFSAEKKFAANPAEKIPFQRTAAGKNSSDTSDPEQYQLLRGEKELNVEFGYSPFQPTFFAEKEYDTSGRSFGMINLRWGRVIGTVKGVTYEYQIEATPIAIAFKNEVVNPDFQSAQTTPNVPPTIRRTTYGAGFSPLGFRFLFRPKKRLKPFAASHGGFAFFNNPVPQPGSLTFALVGDFGGGLQYQITGNKAINLGYKYSHISNGNFSDINPGYNANIFYVGYSFFYK